MNKKTEQANVNAFWALLRAGLWENIKVNGERLKVKGSLFAIPEPVDWEAVFQLAEEQSVIGVVLEGIDWFRVHDSEFTIPQEVLLEWIGEVQMLEQQNQEMNDFVAELIERLRAAGVYTLLVKGQGIAQCYEKPLWRCCGDVDLFLDNDNYQRAKVLLVPIATEVEKEYAREKHLGMTIDGFVVELHGTLRSGLSSRVEKGLDEIKKDIFYQGKVRSWMNGRTQVFLPDADEDVVYVFTHMLQHYYKEGLGLRQVCDWCRLLWTYRSELDLQLLESRIREMGLMSEWRAFSAFAIEYLGMPIDAMPLFDGRCRKDDGGWEIDKGLKRKADKICAFILEVGNMGHNRVSWLKDHDSWLSQKYVVRKVFSMGRRCGDLIRHARIFPLDSLRFFPYIMYNGLRSAARGE